jgi:hypothetical protein
VQAVLALAGLTAFSTVVLWIGYSFATGRAIRQRLTEPEPIPEPV